jgi:hypothetical protein
MLSRYPRGEWDQHTVGEGMERDLRSIGIAPDADALEGMQRTAYSRLLVIDGDRLVGIVSLKDLLRFLQLKLELGGQEGEPESQAPGMPPVRRREETTAHLG